MLKDLEVNFCDDYSPLSAEERRCMAVHTQRKREQGPGESTQVHRRDNKQMGQNW